MKMKTLSKIIGFVILSVVVVSVFAFLVCPALVIHLVFFDTYAMNGDIRALQRTNEKLPTVNIQNGDTVYCRMRMCDFSFPLPDGARVVRTNIDDGGGDTINGEVYVAGPMGGPVNMRAYAEQLEKKDFVAAPCDGTGCPEVTNHMADVPFVSGRDVIHYPLFNDFTASSKNPEGGFMEISVESNLTEIKFGYFGDY
jgi:hypothetical protein